MDRNIDYDGHSFIAGKVKVNSTVVQKSQPSANDFDLLISAVDQTMISAITSSRAASASSLVR